MYCAKGKSSEQRAKTPCKMLFELREIYWHYRNMKLLDGVWYPVVRYDTSHGFAHRDLLNIKAQKRKTPLFITDKNDALTFAENDIKDN